MTVRARALIATLAAVALATACGGGGEPAETRAGGDTLAAPADTGGLAEAPSEPVTSRPTEVSGQAVFTANCATCHGEDGRGDGPAAVGLEPPPANFTDDVWTTGDGSLAAIENTIRNGSPGTAMIAWRGTLTDTQIEAVARYVKSLSEGP